MSNRYLQGTITLPAEDKAWDSFMVHAAEDMGDLAEVWKHEDGSVTINYLQRKPVQPGQAAWIGRGK